MILRKSPLLFAVTQQPIVAVLTPLQNARRFEWRCLVQHLAQEFFEAELEILGKRGEIRKRFVDILDVWQKVLSPYLLTKTELASGACYSHLEQPSGRRGRSARHSADVFRQA